MGRVSFEVGAGETRHIDEEVALEGGLKGGEYRRKQRCMGVHDEGFGLGVLGRCMCHVFG